MYHHRYPIFSHSYSIPFQKTLNIIIFHSLFLAGILTIPKIDVTQRVTLREGLIAKTTRSIPSSLEPTHNLMILHNPIKHDGITENPLSHEIKSTLL